MVSSWSRPYFFYWRSLCLGHCYTLRTGMFRFVGMTAWTWQQNFVFWQRQNHSFSFANAKLWLALLQLQNLLYCVLILTRTNILGGFLSQLQLLLSSKLNLHSLIWVLHVVVKVWHWTWPCWLVKQHRSCWMGVCKSWCPYLLRRVLWAA